MFARLLYHARLFGQDVRESLAGSQRDFTEGSLGRALLVLSIPMVLEMLMQAIFEVADVFFVARLGADAVAAVGLTASMLILVFAVGIGLSMAAMAVVARRIGEHDADAAGRAAVQSILLAVVVSIPVGVLGVAFAPEMLRLMGGTPEVVATGSAYCAILFGSNVTILLLFLINAVLRGAGDAAGAMRVLALANGLNVVLDPVLIFGLGPIPAFGLEGAAWATVVGRGVGVAYQLRLLARPEARLVVRREHLHVDRALIGRLLRVSGPGVLQYLVGTASWLGVMRLVAVFGSAATAGYTIAVRIFVFALLPSWGMGNAAAALVGQSLGAGKPRRAMRAVWLAAAANAVFLGLVSLVLLRYDAALVALFTREADVVAVGAACLHIVAYSYVFFAVGMVVVQAFNGAGDTVTPTWINLFAYWLVQIPLAYGLALPLSLGAEGIFVAIAVSQSVLAVAAVAVFRRGRWQTRMV